jgi:superfamily II helicase
MKTAIKLLSLAEWYEYAYQKFGRDSMSGMVALEQAYLQSKHNKVCVNCLGTDNLVLQTGRQLIKCTDYYMCQECLDYYKNKD